MGPLADLDLTMEQLDNTLDTVDELLQKLPLSDGRKKQLASRVYDLWMEVEHDILTEFSVDSTN